ncbi:hypothetical protein [Acetonema longum]|uniref:Uncharacterized protein n=1 Tax=Acetonema longum DSM 6540 TaxID=1009370 RepID=F7NEF9_9FIRM|nr:hypothetical protein [Acetonema longum]EGO65370.1 hypothetical protein ALO_02111 [Acetonema longum DSM 6540]
MNRSFGKIAKQVTEFSSSAAVALEQMNHNLALIKNIIVNQKTIIQQNDKIIELLTNNHRQTANENESAEQPINP